MQDVNGTMMSAGLSRSTNVVTEFSRGVWDSIDAAINLDDCDIYSFDAVEDDFVDDPFAGDSGVM
jgi:hypothetical protein